MSTERIIWNYLISCGMTEYGAAGLIGNLYAESGLIPGRVEMLCLKRLSEAGKKYNDATYTAAVDSGKISRAEFLNPLPGNQYGYGIAQWTSPGRKAGLYDLCKSRGVSVSDLGAQLDYLRIELEADYRSVFNSLKTATSVRQASDIVLTKFECPADCSEEVKAARTRYGQKYYEKFRKEEECVKTAQDIISIMAGWVGLDRASGTHKPIIDLYNSHTPLARGYEVTYRDEYCATTVSAAFIKADAVSLIGGTECGVEEFIQIFKGVGIWREDGNITPEPGYIICYNWDDYTQPNDGYSDHIGIVEKVSGNQITVLEGNIGGKVGRRTIPVGWGFIRGYACPKYAEVQEEKKEMVKSTVTLYELKKGDKHPLVKTLQHLLNWKGYKGSNGKALSEDGDFGSNTEYAVKTFQEKTGLKISRKGTVGAKTWMKLLS